MITGPYAAMKDSGVAWLGAVPEHWHIQRLKRCASNVVAQTNVKEPGDLYIALDQVESWTGRLRTPSEGTEFDSQVKRFHSNDVLFGKLRPYLAKVCRPTQSGVCVGEFLVLRPRERAIRSDFLEQLLRSRPAIVLINSSTFGAKMPRADWDFIGSVGIPLPPTDEQAAIVKFLDHAERSNRRYIGAKRNLIKLLEEQKQAIIQRAVTHGLDPNVRLKPSGVEWLGDVPEHWEVRRLKTIFREVDVRSLMGTEVLLSLRMHRGLVPHTEVSNVPITSDALIGFKHCRPGQLVMNRMRAAIGMFGIARQPGLVSPDYAVFDSRKPMNEDFILDLFQTPAMRTVFRIESKGLGTGSSGFMRLYSDRFGVIKIALSPLSEQGAIVRHLEIALGKLNDGIDRADREITLLTEYRTRLIADVVTGKLDARAAAAALPEPPETEELVAPESGEDAPEDIEDAEIDADELESELHATVDGLCVSLIWDAVTRFGGWSRHESTRRHPRDRARRLAVMIEVEGLNHMLLGRSDKRTQLRKIDRIGAVVVLGTAENPIVQADERFRVPLTHARVGVRRNRRVSHLRDD
jgi:type I restriction enzyme S subunit